MSYNIKKWSDPITLDANSLNRLEQGIKNSHDTLEILKEETANLQLKDKDIISKIDLLTKNSPNILQTLHNIQETLNNNDVNSILSSMDSFLMKSKQSLTDRELSQVYSNLKLNTFLKLKSITVNGKNVVEGSMVNIELPKVDEYLNINSTNAISNRAVAEALKNLKLSNTSGSNTNISGLADWVLQPEKPSYYFSEILGKPELITKTEAKQYTNEAIIDLIDGAPEALDTLKEISEWIASDEYKSAELLAEIESIKKDYLPLSGGTLTGKLNLNTTYPQITTNQADFIIQIKGGKQYDFTNTEFRPTDGSKDTLNIGRSDRRFNNAYFKGTVQTQGIFSFKHINLERGVGNGADHTDNILGVWNQPLQVKDKNDKTICAIESGFMDDNRTLINMICYKGTSATDNSNARIEVGWNPDGTAYTYCGPSPTASSNDNSIATTAWVKARTDTFVDLTSDQSITGIKTFDRYKAKVKITNSDIRYLLSTPGALTTTAKRYIVTIAEGNDVTAANSNVYSENGKLYSNSSEVVNLKDDQTITGLKICQRGGEQLRFKNTSIDLNSPPSSGTRYSFLNSLDKNGYRLGSYQISQNTSNALTMSLFLCRAYGTLKTGSTIKTNSQVNGIIYSADTTTTADITITSISLKSGSIIAAGSKISGTTYSSITTLTKDLNPLYYFNGLNIVLDVNGNGSVTTPTPAVLANNTRIATTQWAIENIIGTAINSGTVNNANLKSFIANIQANASGGSNLINANNSISGNDDGIYHHLINLGGGVAKYSSQISLPYVTGMTYNKMSIRTADNGTWRKWSEVITDDPAQLLREKYIRTLKICINDTTEDTSSSNYRWPLASPIAYSTAKRYLVGIEKLNTRYSNAIQNVYTLNNDLYASLINTAWFCGNNSGTSTSGWYKFLSCNRASGKDSVNLNLTILIRSTYNNPNDAFGELHLHVRYGTKTTPDICKLQWGSLYNFSDDCVQVTENSSTGQLDFYIKSGNAYQLISFTILSATARINQDFATNVPFTKVTTVSATPSATSITAKYVSSQQTGVALPIGAIFSSALPINDSRFLMLDGRVISQEGIYSEFTTYIKSLKSTYPSLFASSLSAWNTENTNYGQCGKFFIDDTAKTIKIPRIVHFIAGTNTTSSFGVAELDTFKAHTHTAATLNTVWEAGTYKGNGNVAGSGNTGSTGSSETKPKNVRYPYYIVAASNLNKNITVNLNEVMTDLATLQTTIANQGQRYVIASAYTSSYWYEKYNDGWIRQGGKTTLDECSSKYITLPISMTTTTYSTYISNGTIKTASDAEGAVMAATYSKTQIQISAGYTNPNTINVYWEVEGK